ncbi:MAG: DUF86 domain-containing protein [Pseudorhodoplanes sp.]|uniref:HepT-like ribonuclease domain-containing protein n=1 Tax=Pseudorhodoplanes sp. TaxID=1934341 RepID=UPI003D11B60D
MTDRTYWRLTDIKAAIIEINKLLEGKSSDILSTDRAVRAAFERFLEIASEASRHIPQEWKDEFSEIPWRRVADLGNHIRHVYHKIDLDLLWLIYTEELPRLEAVIEQLINRAKPPR